MAQLPGDGRHRHAVALPLGALPLVELAQGRVVQARPARGQPERAAQVRRSVLGDGPAAAVEHARLAHRRVEARVAHQGGGVAEPGDVAYLGDDLGAGRVGHARYREHERLDAVEQPPHLGLDLGALRVEEVHLPHERPHLEGRRPLPERDADRAARERLYLGGLAVHAPAPARRRGDVALQRVDPPAADLGGQRAPREHRAPGGAEHVGEDPGELREVRVEQARALHLDLGELRLERLVVAREGPQGLHVVGREPRGVVLAYAHRLGDEAGVDAVVLDAAQALEPAHRAHLQRVYDRHRVPLGREERVQRHPVAPGGLHAHQDVGGGTRRRLPATPRTARTPRRRS